MTAILRLPVAAGTFYPLDPARLEADVCSMLAVADRVATDDLPFALVVPHAGYRYSGPIAASAYGRIRSWAGSVRRVALVGPSHFEPCDGAVVSGARAWRTPLGDVEIDDELRRLAVEAGAAIDEAPHAREHALEVQLPWLQFVLGTELRIAPVAIGMTTADVAATLIAALGEVADL